MVANCKHKILEQLCFFLFLLLVELPDNRQNSVVVIVSASQSVDLGFIFQLESYQKTLKNGIHRFPAWRSAHRDSVEKKPSLLVVSLGKALNGTPLPLCSRQVVWPSSLPVVVAPVLLQTCKPSVSANAV